MISETKFRVENYFRVEIFEIFRFQKHAPNMENWRVKKFQNSKILTYCVCVCVYLLLHLIIYGTLLLEDQIFLPV